MQCDDYAAYEHFEQMKGITLTGCWAYVRRKYVDALEENRPLATQAIHYIDKLYKIESDANDAGLTTEERKGKRISEAYLLILEFEKWLQDAYLRVLPKIRMGKAIEYTYTLLPRLFRYVKDGRIEIDDNRIENTGFGKKELSVLRQRRIRIQGCHRVLTDCHLQISRS